MQVTEKKKKEDWLRRPIAFCVCMYYKSGQYDISNMTKKGLEQFVKDNFKDKKTGINIASPQNVVHTLLGYNQDQIREKAVFCYSDKTKKWEFKEDNFEYMKTTFPEDYSRALKLLNELN